MSDRPTFSQSWSRVDKLTPTLRPQVSVQRQLFRSEPWHVVHDPVTNQFFRLNPVAWHLVGLLDGKRTVDEVWRMTLDRFGDDAPTQNEVIGLLSQLNQSNLLRVDLPADAEPLVRRQNQRRMRQVKQHAMSLLYLKIPVFNPDRLLTWLAPLARPFLSRWGVIAWVLWMSYCIYQFLPEVGRFMRDVDSALEPRNWAWMLVMFLLVKGWHELGHGLVCKRFGGAVPEFGAMLMVFMPAPYVDATSSWNFADKRKRILVGGAGMLFELAVAGLAALIWLSADPSSLTRQLSYNVVLLASVTTIVFNANPLMRFDGYYMLSDYLEVPNMADRSVRHLRWLAQRFAYGMQNAQAVASALGEMWLLAVYGVLSLLYRVFIILSIALLLAEHLLVVGMALAAWSIFAFTVLPLCKMVHWLATSPQLHEHRARAVGVTIAATAVILVIIGLIPFEEHRRAEGVVESANRADVSMKVDGFVTDVRVQTGQSVKAGDVILVAENPQLSDRRAELAASLKREEVALRQSLSKEAIETPRSQAKVDALRKELSLIDERMDNLTLRSPQDGVIAGGQMQQLLGQFLKRGKVIGLVQDLDTMRVTALVDQSANGALFDEGNSIRAVELRTAGAVPVSVKSSVLQAFPAGRQQLPHPALATSSGGAVATDPQDTRGQTALRPQFEFWLDLPRKIMSDRTKDMPAQSVTELGQYPGQRVYVRFTLEHKRPLLHQWIHRVRQLLRDRLSI
jgi:putative peptide zinc metalloprotease protein